jgi:hypothetical protein
MALLVGGPLSGTDMSMPEDLLVTKVSTPGGRLVSYSRTRVRPTSDDPEVEVWGWTPLCYRLVKETYLAMVGT